MRPLLRRSAGKRGVEPSEVKELDLRTYFAYLRQEAAIAPTTANTEATHVKSAYRCAAEDGLIERSHVTRRVRLPKVPDRDPEPYIHEELRRLRAAIADDLDEVLLYAFAYGGLRRHELAELTRDRIDFESSVAATSLRREGVHGDVIDRIFGWSARDIRERHYSSGVDDAQAAPG